MLRDYVDENRMEYAKDNQLICVQCEIKENKPSPKWRQKNYHDLRKLKQDERNELEPITI